MMAFKYFVATLCLMLMSLWMLYVYELSHRVYVLQDRIHELEVEARPIVLTKYGPIYLNGREIWKDPYEEVSNNER